MNAEAESSRDRSDVTGRQEHLPIRPGIDVGWRATPGRFLASRPHLYGYLAFAEVAHLDRVGAGFSRLDRVMRR